MDTKFNALKLLPVVFDADIGSLVEKEVKKIKTSGDKDGIKVALALVFFIGYWRPAPLMAGLFLYRLRVLSKTKSPRCTERGSFYKAVV